MKKGRIYIAVVLILFFAGAAGERARLYLRE